MRLGRTVAELMESISTHELQSWRAFDAISPIGDERVDLLFGMLMAHMAHLTPGQKKKFKPADFMPFVDKPDKSVALSEQIRRQFLAHTEKAE